MRGWLRALVDSTLLLTVLELLLATQRTIALSSRQGLASALRRAAEEELKLSPRSLMG
jgi:hypothetical protein